MSLELVGRAIQRAQLRENDGKWFPQWLARYAAWGNISADQELPVNRDLTIGFLQSIKAQGKPAWQRLRAARAIEFYAVQVRRIETAGRFGFSNSAAGTVLRGWSRWAKTKSRSF